MKSVFIGVITEKLNRVSKPKGTEVALISATNGETNFEKREKVYSDKRDVLVTEFRYRINFSITI